MPIFSLKIDPTRAAGSERIIYCGTNGFGAYRTTVAVDGSDYDWNNMSWTGVSGLSTTLVGQGASYTVNNLSISYQNPDRVVAATNEGLFLITGGGAPAASPISIPASRNANHHPGALVTTYSSSFTSVFSDVVIDPTDDRFMYAAGKNQGVVRFIWNGTTYVYDGTLYDDEQNYSVVEFYDWPWSANTGTIATPTWETGTLSRPRNVILGSGTMEFNCLAMTPQNPNVLYTGFTKYLESRDPDVFKVGYIKFDNIRSSEYLYVGRNSFIVGGTPGPGGAAEYAPPGYTGGYPDGNPETLDNWRYIGANATINFDLGGGIIHSIAIDPNTPSTLWRGKNNSIQRSTDDGDTFSSLGTYVNVRDIFIDPINTINVYIVTESGLYKTKDAGASWKQIKSGLEGNTTLNTLGLTPGDVGMRRIFLGNTNGIFIGRTSLDLE